MLVYLHLSLIRARRNRASEQEKGQYLSLVPVDPSATGVEAGQLMFLCNVRESSLLKKLGRVLAESIVEPLTVPPLLLESIATYYSSLYEELCVIAAGGS